MRSRKVGKGSDFATQTECGGSNLLGVIVSDLANDGNRGVRMKPRELFDFFQKPFGQFESGFLAAIEGDRRFENGIFGNIRSPLSNVGKIRDE